MSEESKLRRRRASSAGGYREAFLGHLVGGGVASYDGRAEGHLARGRLTGGGGREDQSKVMSARVSSGIASPRRALFQWDETALRRAPAARRPAWSTLFLKEDHLGRVILSDEREAHRSRTSDQKRPSSRWVRGGSRGAGLANSTLGERQKQSDHTK